MSDPLAEKYNTDLTDYYAKVLAECDGGDDCPNPAAHDEENHHD